MNEFVSLKEKLGKPTRYAYKATPAVLYLETNHGFEKSHMYSVSFELACDLFSIEDAKGEGCIKNPYLINIMEPGVEDDIAKPYVSHCVLLDEHLFHILDSAANKDGHLRRYSGVVDGYSVQDIKSVTSDKTLLETGLCLFDGIISAGGLLRPDKPFNENRHTRFLQASESYQLKENKLRRKKSDTLTCDLTLFDKYMQRNRQH